MKLRARFSLVAAVFALALIATPLASWAIEIESLPSTASAGVAFEVVAIPTDDGPVTIQATRVSGSSLTRSFAATRSAQAPSGGARLAADVTLPTGGDWDIAAIEDSESSATRTVSCNPGKYRFTTVLGTRWVNYSSPSAYSATVLKADGSPLVSSPVQLCVRAPWDDSTRVVVVRTLNTNVLGQVNTKINNRGTWFAWVAGRFRVEDELEWAWRVPANGTAGSATSGYSVTTVKWVMSKPTPDFVTGKVKLVKGRTYQFVFWTANEGFEPGYFTVHSLSGTRYVNYDVRKRDLLGAFKTFTVPKTATYRWRMSGVAGHSCTVGIW